MKRRSFLAGMLAAPAAITMRQVQTLNCPNCGAPLEPSGSGEKYFKCSYCGTTMVEDKPLASMTSIGTTGIPLSSLHGPRVTG